MPPSAQPVRLSADYSASPMWLQTERGWSSVGLDRFDLSPGLRLRVELGPTYTVELVV